MQARQLRHDLDELFEVVERAVAPPALEIAHERRAVDRGEHLVVAADAHALRRVARMLGEFARRGLAQLARGAAVEAHARALDVGAGGFPDFERLRVVAEFEADLADDPVGLLLELDEAFLAEEFVERDLALDEGRRLRPGAFATTATVAPPPGAARASALCPVGHAAPPKVGPAV